MPKRSDKPTSSEILKQFEFCKKYYSTLQQRYEDDERFYNLDFDNTIPCAFFAGTRPLVDVASAVVLLGQRRFGAHGEIKRLMPFTVKPNNIDTAQIIVSRAAIHAYKHVLYEHEHYPGLNIHRNPDGWAIMRTFEATKNVPGAVVISNQLLVFSQPPAFRRFI